MYRRHLLSTAPAAILGAAVSSTTPALASTGYPVTPEGIADTKRRDAFAKAIDASVAKDPTGKGEIVGFSTDGFYAPIHVYQTLRAFHPNLDFVRKEVPGKAEFSAMTLYIQLLQLTTLTEPGEYYNSALRRRNGTGPLYLDLNFRRTLPAGTPVWIDRNTDRVVFKANCGNGLKKVVEEKRCAYIMVPALPGDGFMSVTMYGPAGSWHCTFSYQGPGTGPKLAKFDPANYKPIAGACALRWCGDQRNIEAYLRKQVTVHPGGKRESGSFPVTPGWWIIKVPIEVAESHDHLVDVCMAKEDGTTVSLGADVWRPHYRTQPNGDKLAIIWGGEHFVPAEYRHDRLWIEWDLSRQAELLRSQYTPQH